MRFSEAANCRLKTSFSESPSVGLEPPGDTTIPSCLMDACTCVIVIFPAGAVAPVAFDIDEMESGSGLESKTINYQCALCIQAPRVARQQHECVLMQTQWV